jgi:hypothetical protein
MAVKRLNHVAVESAGIEPPFSVGSVVLLAILLKVSARSEQLGLA